MTTRSLRAYDLRRRPRTRRPARRAPRRGGRIIGESRLLVRVEVRERAYEAPLPQERVRVGSGADCDLRLGCEGVGRVQCVLEPLGDGRHVLRDLNSGFPTCVNGIEVHQVSLRPGDVVEVGEARIVYGAEAASPATGEAGGARARNGARPAAAASSTRRTVQARRSVWAPLAGLGVAAAVAVVLAVLAAGGDSRRAGAEAERRLEEALHLYRAKDWPAAREALRALTTDPQAGDAGRTAGRYLTLADQAVGEAQADLDRLWARRLEFDFGSAATVREIFVQRHGPAFDDDFEGLLERIRGAQAEWVDEQVRSARAASERLLEDERFGEARREWTALPERLPPGTDLDFALTDGLEEVERRAAAAAGAELARIEEVAARRGPAFAAARLAPLLARYQGTRAHETLVVALRRLEAAAAARPAGVDPEAPEPAAGPGVVPPPERPEVPPPAAARVEEALAEAEQAAAAWDLARSVEILEGVGEEAGSADPRVAARLEDLTLALSGLDRLVEDIEARPQRYRRLEMGPRFQVSLVAADREFLTFTVPGGTSRQRWAALSLERIVAVVGRFDPEGEPALAAAALLRHAGGAGEAERYVYRAGQGGVPTSRLFPLLARWRGEPLPADGYVAYEERYVTPQERDRLVLEARIRDACVRVEDRDESVRRQAYEELLSLGRPAREALLDALGRRRRAVIEELSDLPVFGSSRTRARLFEELQRRREHALSLIEDARAWPYPNPTGRNTQEVAARVDAVREVWERPFDVIVQWDEDLRDRLALLTEVDEVMVRADPRHEPTLDDLRDRVNRAVNMPAYTPNSRATSVREYSLKVLAYNERLDTTATREERANVLAVNEYRMMMGRHALKIDERLVRAARGHSRHMRTQGYFAHNVPAGKGADATNRTPGARAKRQGYGGGVGENIAMGTWTGRDAFWAWFGSSGHHRNMLAAGWTEMGAGRSGGSWWTQLFGAARGKSLSTPDALAEPTADVAPEAEDETGRPLEPSRPRLPDEAPPGEPPPLEEDLPEEEPPDAPDGG